MNATDGKTAATCISVTVREEVVGSGNLVYSLIRTNTLIEEQPVCVYGIQIKSTLFQSEEIDSITDISTDFSMVNELFETLVRNLVLPCTLKDIVYDYLAQTV